MQVAETGNTSVRASSWLGDAVYYASDAFSEVANQILEDSLEENSLKSSNRIMKPPVGEIASAETMTSRSTLYGSFGGSPERTQRKTGADTELGTVESTGRRDKRVRLMDEDHIVSFVVLHNICSC